MTTRMRGTIPFAMLQAPLSVGVSILATWEASCAGLGAGAIDEGASMPKVRDAPLSAEAAKAMQPEATQQAECFLMALLWFHPVDSRRAKALAREIGISRTALKRARAALGIVGLPRGRHRLWARPDYASRPLPPPPTPLFARVCAWARRALLRRGAKPPWE